MSVEFIAIFHDKTRCNIASLYIIVNCHLIWSNSHEENKIFIKRLKIYNGQFLDHKI